MTNTIVAPSAEAVALYERSDVIDLHLDSFIWSRIIGYDLARSPWCGGFR